ncbi:ferrous iron transport protein B [Commensalibacter sp. M0357]|uniref:ferrous iron transport protein B n=1 Tax=unclassified Commensalibacter TaxID=2630218 RepID=UPI0018DEABF0|nr:MULTISPECIES: ferrous iron transport protein B [unclassified Commensalibacter]MBI0075726.1 ferrous iron transport protein B [Commensalibacter sp. M0357]MBI0085581.1 ferrous iron transport protein B [Commensalibacter sp. M0355]
MPESSIFPISKIALVGNPNCGKTALFNQLTGSRQKVANYAGVTVERKEGQFVTPSKNRITLIDLPGAYSLKATSLDEAVTRDICMGNYRNEPPPDALICVIDATNLRLHLRFALEICRLKRPMMIALNMSDIAKKRKIDIDIPKLESILGICIIPTIGTQKNGIKKLVDNIDTSFKIPTIDIDNQTDLHVEVRKILLKCVHNSSENSVLLDEKIDRLVLHPIIGPLILLILLFIMFQAVFSWAQPFMDGIQDLTGWLGKIIANLLPTGPLRSLIIDGVFAGVGTTFAFLPQILVLFLWILFLEESGYLPRAAFLLDRIMASVGLNGRSFIPLLSSFACAIPGIMATRTIPSARDRLVTILIAPLMTCSARLPVYALLISAFIPHKTIGIIFNLQGLVLFGLYLLGIASAFLVALLLKKRKKSYDNTLLLELPSYRFPSVRNILFGLWQRIEIFVNRVGTIILTVSILLWALSSFPKPPAGVQGPAIDWSFAGIIGHWIQPLFAPIGFNWEICVALILGLAAREVAVTSLATVYSIAGVDSDAPGQLVHFLSTQWSIATGLSFLAWYVFAPQCFSTLAVIKKETSSWKMVIMTACYLFFMAYFASFTTWHIASFFS